MSEKPNIFSKLSLYFIKNYRLTVLVILVTLLAGFFTYASLLRREGFPAINVPIAFVQTPYFVKDPAKVEEEITTPIADAISDIDIIKSVSTTSTDIFSSVVIEFEDNVDSEEGLNLVRDEIIREVTFPEAVSPVYRTFDAGKIDGIHDLVFTISSDKPLKEQQAKADEIAQELNSLDTVAKADVIKLIENRTDFTTGKEVELQTGFIRSGYMEDGELVFKDGINIGIIKKNEAIGTLELSESIKLKIDDLEKEGLLEGYKVVFSGDSAETLESQLKSLQDNTIIASLTIIVVIFFFINWRSSIVLGLVFLPLVLGSVFLSLYIIGYTLNTISLFALVLVLGLFVDDGTIIVEAIDYYKKQGVKGKQAVIKAINSVGVADISGTLTTLLVFVPLVFVSGILGDFIRLLPITVILSLALSLIIALTILPAVSNILIPNEKTTQKKSTLQKVLDIPLYGFTNLISFLAGLNAKLVRFYLGNPVLTFAVIGAAIIIIGAGGFYASKLKFSIFPTAKDGDSITVELTFPNNRDLTKAQSLSREVEEVILNNAGDYIKQVDYLSADESSAQLSIKLNSISEREPTSNDIAQKITTGISFLDGVTGKAASQGAGPTPSEYPFAMQIYAYKTETLLNLSEDIKTFIADKEIEGDVTVLDVIIENTDNISKRDGSRYSQLRAKLSDNQNTGAIVALQDLIEKEFDADKLEEYELPKTALGFDFGQESSNLESFQSTVVAFVAALGIIYILLVIQFNSFSQPLLVFIAIPMSFPLLFPGLYITDNAFSFFVQIGLTGLIGIVVNNTIMLIDYANQHRKSGMSIKDSISKAIQLRFRPILTTSVTTIAGLLPLAIAEPFWEPLAFTIIFGLTSSVIMVLFFFPAFYAVFDKLREVKDRLFPGLKNLEAD